MFDDLEWKGEAECKDANTDLFFSQNYQERQEAFAMCERCTVQSVCLAFALDNRMDSGIWGGTSEAARHRLRKELS